MKNRLKWMGASTVTTLAICYCATADVGADNTKVNERYSSPTEVTADQQNRDPRDTEITRLIRRELMQDATLSTYGQNVKIVTEKGRVTLNGPVASNAERERIVDTAARIAGRRAVVSGLDIVK